jgi:hypothetical protein
MPIQLEYWHPCALRDVEHPDYMDFLGLYPTLPQFPSLAESIRVTLPFLKVRTKEARLVV